MNTRLSEASSVVRLMLMRRKQASSAFSSRESVSHPDIWHTMDLATINFIKIQEVTSSTHIPVVRWRPWCRAVLAVHDDWEVRLDVRVHGEVQRHRLVLHLQTHVHLIRHWLPVRLALVILRIWGIVFGISRCVSLGISSGGTLGI